MKRILSLAAAAALLLAAGLSGTGCKEIKELAKFDTSTVLGMAGEVIVIMDKADWEGAPGATVRAALESPVDFLDPAENKFKLYFVQKGNLSRQLQMNRNLLMFEIGEDCEKAEVLYIDDMYAHPQIVVKIKAHDADEAARLVADNADAIYRKIELAEINRNVLACYRYELKDITAKIEAFAGGSPRIPNTGYVVAAQAPGFIWLNNATTYVTSGVIVTTYPATGENDLDPNELTRHLREQINTNVPGGPEGSYMDIVDSIFPIVSDLKVNGRSIKQIRSRWTINGDTMGGPYVSHSFLTPDGKNVVTMMAFLFCQRYDNRTYFRKVESILYSFKWKE